MYEQSFPFTENCVNHKTTNVAEKENLISEIFSERNLEDK